MLRITIKTDNDAFSESPREEIANILETLVEALRNYRPCISRPLMDSNGNKVGSAESTGNTSKQLS